ncbi:hypothetical protein K2173_016886 [Erythroxylum novogranatense]|uniref:Uncharacterized protein n=1 Tax=Erythroxylum novogranatense TaxID=1862640 RepID=A0AAV8U7X1_9ROSI|nr:hypothetical protein K2173_016886 [Erythroxylum novogranatense]
MVMNRERETAQNSHVAADLTVMQTHSVDASGGTRALQNHAETRVEQERQTSSDEYTAQPPTENQSDGNNTDVQGESNTEDELNSESSTDNDAENIGNTSPIESRQSITDETTENYEEAAQSQPQQSSENNTVAVSTEESRVNVRTEISAILRDIGVMKSDASAPILTTFILILTSGKTICDNQ